MQESPESETIEDEPVDDRDITLIDSETNIVRSQFRRLSPRATLRGVFLLLGIGILLPWNAFISAKAYFQSRLCDPSGNDRANSDSMEATFAFVYNLSSVISLGGIIFGRWLRNMFVSNETVQAEVLVGQIVDGIYRDDDMRDVVGDDESRERVSSNLPPIRRNVQQRQSDEENSTSSIIFVILPFSVFLVVFLLQMWLVVSVHFGSAQSLRFWTLLSITVCGVCSAMATAGVVATAGRFKEAEVAMNPFLAVC